MSKSKGIANLGHYFKEVLTILKLNKLSGLLSVFSLTLIFFVALMAAGSWRVSVEVVKALEQEAEVSVYYDLVMEEHQGQALKRLKDQIAELPGVREILPIGAEEAYQQMKTILGRDAAVLEHFSENPFEPYLEVAIELDQLEVVLEGLVGLEGILYVRDNQSVLERVASIAKLVTGIGIFVAVAVGIATLMVTAHIIREGVHANREQIMTLKLLGAPNGFIFLPYVMEGVLLTTLSGILASVLLAVFLNLGSPLLSESLTFLPPLDGRGILRTLMGIGLMVSAGLGLFASLLGLSMVRNHGIRV